MLIDYFDMPVRKDIIKRAAKFIENEQKEIVDYKKHVIEGEIDHINKNGILDLQRFFLEDGDYHISLRLVDQNDTTNIEEHQQTFTLSKTNSVEFSDVELLDKYWKISN